MKRIKGTALVMLAAVVTIAQGLIFAPTIGAESAALSIVPQKKYTIEPGKSANDTLVIKNIDKERTLDLTLRVIDFTYKDDSGTPDLMLAEDAPQTTWSLKPFLTVPKELTIEPGTSQTVDMSIAIPEGQGAGSYYSAIVYSTASPDGGNVALNASGVTLVFTTIPGQVDEKLTLEKIGAYNSNLKSYQFLTNDEPERIGYTLKNEGNVAQSPVGSITLRNLFGQETVIQNINPNSSLALIGQSRTFTACVKLKKEEVDFNGSRSEANTCAKPGLWPGYYSVELAAFYGQNGNNTNDLVGKGSFWYLPWWFILLVLVVLAFIIYQVWKIRRFIRNKRGGVQLKKRSSRKK